MSRNTLRADAAIAAVLTVLVLVIAPGLAIVGLLAILVLILCAISFAFDLRRHRRRPAQGKRASRPPRRAPRARRPSSRR